MTKVKRANCSYQNIMTQARKPKGYMSLKRNKLQEALG